MAMMRVGETKELDPSGFGAPPVEELLALVLVNLVCLLLISYRNKRRVLVFVPDQAVSILVGISCGGLLRLVTTRDLTYTLLQNFSGIFFEFCLPPIIFSSAYSIKRKAFFKNFGAIMCFAVLGTISCAFFIGGALYFFYENLIGVLQPSVAPTGIILGDRKMPLIDALILGTVLSAVDPVATLAVLPESMDHQVYALLFGESVLNDAVAIVLYNGLTLLHSNIKIKSKMTGVPFESVPLTPQDIANLLVRFVVVSIGSMILGTCVALFSALALKHGSLQNNPGKEQALLLLFAYLSYLVARAAALSPVVSLFTSGAVMSHYSYYNLSRMSQIATATSFSCISHVAETFVFVFLGISVFSALFVTDLSKDITLIVLLVFVCIAARLIIVIMLSQLINLTRYLSGSSKRISLRAQIFLAWSGIRGAVSFALAIHAPVLDSKGAMITSTICVILFSFFVQGVSARWLVRVLGLEEDEYVDPSELYSVFDPSKRSNNVRSPSVYMEEAVSPRTAVFLGLKRESKGEYGYVAKFWRRFDDKYMKALFGGRPREEAMTPALHSHVSFNEEMLPGEEQRTDTTRILSGIGPVSYGSFREGIEE